MNKKLKKFLIVTGVVTTFFSNSVLAQITQIPENMEGRTFKEAKHQMHNIFEKLYHPQTLYCGCDIAFNRFWYFPNLQSCGYQIRSDKNKKRAQRIEAEHIMPAWEFGHNMQCWGKRGGRFNCEHNDELFRVMESDLHNLYPAVGEINGDRSNYLFSDSIRAPSPYGECNMSIDRKRQRVTPPERARGVIARAYLYMSERYGIELDDEHRNLFNQWNKKYKPDENECERNIIIGQVQGNLNHFVTEKCR